MKLETSCSGNTFLCTSARESMWFNAKLACAYEQVTARLFFLTLTKLLKKKKRSRNFYIHAHVLLQKLQMFHLWGVSASSASGPYVTSWRLFVTVAPHWRALFFILVSGDVQKWTVNMRGPWANWKHIPGLLPRWAATLAFKRPNLFQMCFVIYWPNIPLFLRNTEGNSAPPDTEQASCPCLSGLLSHSFSCP